MSADLITVISGVIFIVVFLVVGRRLQKRDEHNEGDE